MKRICIGVISILLILSSMPWYVFAEDTTNAVEQTTTEVSNETLNTNDTEDNTEENESTPVIIKDKVQVDDTIIYVDGKFEEEGNLFVEKIKHKKDLSDNNVAKAYSYDIKVLNSNKEELQPIEPVKVSFEFVNLDTNLTPEVYHEKEQLDVDVKKDTLVVESDGFSIYTVEFTYEDKEYVLEGDTYVKLSDLLSSIGINGEVSSWEISNDELFTILKGDESGISYDAKYIDEVEYATPIDNPNGNILYMVALQMFNTEEWLDITIEGITYRIIVTDDAYVNGQTQSKITDSRVEQGGNETNFTATMPLATIFIDEDIVNMDAYKLTPPTTKTQEQYDAYVAEHGENPSWNVGDIDYDNPENTGKMVARLLYDSTAEGARTGMKVNTDTEAGDAYGQLYFDFEDGDWDKGTTANNHVINTWNGPVVEYRFINAAERFNTETQQYERMDVIITYSNVNISMQYNFNMDNYSKLTKYDILDANKIQPKLFASSDLGGNANDRTGLKLDVNIQVVDKNDNLIPGSYYFPLVDADIGRSGQFGNLYQGTTNENNYYSEQFVLLDNYGQPTSTGEWEQKIWIPGGDYDKSKAASQVSNMPYLSNIDSINGNLRIKPGAGYSSIPANGYEHPVTGNLGRDEDFYTGFATLANNTDGGVKFRYWGNSAYRATPDGSGTVTSYVLAGTQKINHKLDASSDEGGTIYTTTTGNADGSLSGGELMGNNLVNIPHQISTATGQHTTYTMTPKGGYKLKNVYIKKGDIDVLEQVGDGNGETYNIPISELTSKGHGVYTYTFTDIQEDNSIHVEWEKTNLSVTKTIEPEDSNESHRFNFQIRLWDTSTEDSIWRVRARKYNGVLTKDTEIEDGTPYYMTYNESHNEEGEIERYTAVPDSEITDETNPSENGWYESVRFLAQAATQNSSAVYMTRYFVTEDTEPYVEISDITGEITSRKTYYTREVVEGNIERYYQHILGYNEKTNTWESYDIRSDIDNSVVADLGLTDIDATLSDNYRFVEEEGKVYLKSSYDEESGMYTKYLLWVHDDDVDDDILVVGNAELYPEGTPFETDGIYNNYVYIWEDDVEGWSDKIIRSRYNVSVNGQSHSPNTPDNKYKYEKDTHNPVHYDFVNNPDNLDLQDGYTKLTGETGMYIINLPAGQSPDLSAFEGTDWDLLVSRVGAVQDGFDMDAEFISKGATSAAGANTYNFSLAPGETVNFEGCVPMGWNYEITEISLEETIWEKKSNTVNATIEDFDGEEAVGFVNQKKLYDLDITKETVDNAPGTFEFKVKIWHEQVIQGETEEEEPTIHKTPMNLVEQFGLPDADGYYHFNLSNGDSVKIEDILYGYHYEVIEVSQDGWTLESSENAIGVMSKDNVAKFINKKNTSFTLEKKTTVKYDDGRRFMFLIKADFRIPGATSPSSNENSGIYWNYVNAGYNQIVFLEKDQKIVVEDVPYGSHYAIVEANHEWYGSSTGSGGWRHWKPQEEQSGVITENTQVTFTNEPMDAYVSFQKSANQTTNEKFKFKGTFWEVLDDGSTRYVELQEGDAFLKTSFQRVPFTRIGEGCYEFEITTSQTILFNVPYLSYYEFEEITDGEWNPVSYYNSSESKATGQIRNRVQGLDFIFGSPNHANIHYAYSEAGIINLKNYDLTFRKTVTGNMGDKSKKFDFTVKAWYTHNYYAYSSPEDAENEWLSEGMDIRISGDVSSILGCAPDETRGDEKIWWDVTDIFKEYIDEHDIEPYSGNNYYSFEIENGAVLNGNPAKITVDFSATKNGDVIEDVYSVYITIGYFEIEYRDLSEFGGIDNGNGSYTFKLRHGDEVVIPNFESRERWGNTRWQYEIIEKEYSEYEQKVDGQSRRKISGVLTGDKEHNFENKLEGPVPTRVKVVNYGLFILILLIFSLLIINRQKLFKEQ